MKIALILSLALNVWLILVAMAMHQGAVDLHNALVELDTKCQKVHILEEPK